MRGDDEVGASRSALIMPAVLIYCSMVCEAYFVTAMTQNHETGFLPAFDRPLRRLAWVVPVSLCLWILVLAGFSILLGKISPPPPTQPLEVSLADLSQGTAGGSAGGGSGPQGGSGALGAKAAQQTLLPIKHWPVTASASVALAAHPLLTAEHPVSPAILRTRAKTVAKPPESGPEPVKEGQWAAVAGRRA